MKPKLPGKIRQAQTFRAKQQLALFGKTVSDLEWAAIAFMEFPKDANDMQLHEEARLQAIKQVCDRLLAALCEALIKRDHETIGQLAKTVETYQRKTAALPIHATLQLWKAAGIPAEPLPPKEIAKGLNTVLGYKAVDIEDCNAMSNFRKLLRDLRFPVRNGKK